MRFARDFYAAEAIMTDDQMSEFGAPWRLQPMHVAPNHRPTPDSSRPVVSLPLAIFDWDMRNEKLGFREVNVSGRNPELHIHRRDLPAGFEPQQGDWAIRECDGAAFSITEVRRDGASGILLELSQLGRQF